MFFLVSSQLAYAVGPGKGSISKNNITIGLCTANTFTVQYQLDSLLGEPTVNGAYKWTSSDSSCELPASTVVWLKLASANNNYGYVQINPVVSKANKGLGYNVAGSPNWDVVLCGYQGTKATTCLNSSSAKNLWKTGRVVDFQVQWNQSDVVAQQKTLNRNQNMPASTSGSKPASADSTNKMTPDQLQQELMTLMANLQNPNISTGSKKTEMCKTYGLLEMQLQNMTASNDQQALMMQQSLAPVFTMMKQQCAF